MMSMDKASEAPKFHFINMPLSKRFVHVKIQISEDCIYDVHVSDRILFMGS